MKKKIFILTVVLLVSALLTVFVVEISKSPKGQMSHRDGYIKPYPELGERAKKHNENIEKRLNLTEAQKAKLKKNREASKVKMDPLIQQIQKKQDEKFKIIQKYGRENPDLIKLNKEIRELRAQYDVIRKENKKYFESVLTKEQKAELAKMKTERKKNRGKHPVKSRPMTIKK